MKKSLIEISNLAETDNVSNIYIAGVQTVQTKKYNVGDLQDEVSLNLNVVGKNFDPTHTYNTGDYCIYNQHAYKFTSSHTGQWTGTDATLCYLRNDVFGHVFVDDKDVLEIVCSYSDTGAVIPNLTVTVNYFDGTAALTATTDANGYVKMFTPLNKKFEVTLPAINGYNTPEFATYKSLHKGKKFYGIYTPVVSSATCNVKVSLSVGTGGNISQINGNTLSVFKDSSRYESITIADASVNFTCLQDSSANIIFPVISGYVTPYAPSGTIGTNNKNTGYSFQVTGTSMNIPAVYNPQ